MQPVIRRSFVSFPRNAKPKVSASFHECGELRTMDEYKKPTGDTLQPFSLCHYQEIQMKLHSDFVHSNEWKLYQSRDLQICIFKKMSDGVISLRLFGISPNFTSNNCSANSLILQSGNYQRCHLFKIPSMFMVNNIHFTF